MEINKYVETFYVSLKTGHSEILLNKIVILLSHTPSIFSIFSSFNLTPAQPPNSWHHYAKGGASIIIIIIVIIINNNNNIYNIDNNNSNSLN